MKIRPRLALTAPLLLLAACANNPPLAAPVEVSVPVPAPCHSATVAEPPWPLSQARASDDILAKTRLLLAELKARQAYEDLQKAAIVECQ